MASDGALVLFAAIGSVVFAAYLLWMLLLEEQPWRLDDDGPDYLDVYASMRKRARR